jgi:hypothetical protein
LASDSPPWKSASPFMPSLTIAASAGDSSANEAYDTA